MIIYTEATIRTPIEELFLSEMVEEDTASIILGGCGDTIIDNLEDDVKTSIFDDTTSSYNNDVDDIFDYDDDLF